MIQSFRCRDTEKLFKGISVKPFRAFEKVARRKLAMLNAATKLLDLKAPPNNKLEALKDDREGEHSIRVNKKWRVCFVWTPNGPEGVEIVDYH